MMNDLRFALRQLRKRGGESTGRDGDGTGDSSSVAIFKGTANYFDVVFFLVVFELGDAPVPGVE